MKRLTSTLCFVATVFACVPTQAADKMVQPNIIVIFTDDHGYADLGCQDVYSDLRTPHIDSLAAGGVRMINGYITAPQCVPYRGGILTGVYQNRFGLESNTQARQAGGLDGFGKAQTIPERLQTAGYRTGMAGKWHLGPAAEIVQHGFQQIFYKNSRRPALSNFSLAGEEQDIGPVDSGLYHVDACSQAACTFINRFHEEPFFFYLAYRAPHVPLDAPEEYLARFPGEMPRRRRQALAMLAAVDDGVGEILQTLRDREIEERTLIFFISDNGAPLKIHKLDAPGSGPGWDGSLNDPLNGEKGMLSEGGIRTPFLAYWKSVLPAGLKYEPSVISLDVAATANELAGLGDAPELDGVNLIPFLTGKNGDAPHDALYWRWNGQAAMRQSDWKFLRVGQREWLFDLAKDIGETQDMSAQYPDVLKRMRSQWDEWSQDLQPPGMSGPGSDTAHRYFDWYLDGKRDIPIETMDSLDSKSSKPKKGASQKRPPTDAELFRLRDKNKDGVVSLAEFLNGRSGDSLAPLQRRFRARDRDNNGQWEAAEVKGAGAAKQP